MPADGKRRPEFRKIVKSIAAIFGWGEARCANCHSPFFPSELPRIRDLASLRLCSSCQQEFQPYKGDYCATCGLPMYAQDKFSSLDARRMCASCQKNLPPWSALAFFNLYEGQLRDTILRLKFEKELHLRVLLGELLFQMTSCLPKPDFVVPIPQHIDGLRKRGFNQAAEIARIVGKRGGLRLETNCLRRVKKGPPQEELGARERMLNMLGSFRANALAKGKSIWLVDDVMTTGSTLREGAKSLLEAGAMKVCVLVVARTPLN